MPRFVDTNVLVYAVDRDEPEKRKRAVDLLRPGADADLVLSAQVLGEFYVVVTRKLARPLSPRVAQAMIAELRRLPTVAIDADLVAEAIRGSDDWQVSYWDALIVRSAERAGCDVVVSEDFAEGAQYGTVRIENPFATS